MATITAAQVKELRDRTGAGMGDCKKALEATAGDMDAAIEKLRIDGMAKADKKGSRTAAEGMIAVAEGGDAVVLVEVNCETDFVAKGDEFQGLAKKAAELALAHAPATLDDLLALSDGSQTLEEARRAFVAKSGENTTIRRFVRVANAGGALVHYLHGSRIGVVVSMSAGDAQLAKDIALHVAAMSPRFLDEAAVPAEFLEAEKKIIEAQSAEAAAGKPAEIVAKMMEGKVRKMLADVTLVGQPFVRNEEYGMKSDEPLSKLLKAKGAAIKEFARIEVGEGIEKKQTDFAAEVAAAAQA